MPCCDVDVQGVDLLTWKTVAVHTQVCTAILQGGLPINKQAKDAMLWRWCSGCWPDHMKNSCMSDQITVTAKYKTQHIYWRRCQRLGVTCSIITSALFFMPQTDRVRQSRIYLQNPVHKTKQNKRIPTCAVLLFNPEDGTLKQIGALWLDFMVLGAGQGNYWPIRGLETSWAWIDCGYVNVVESVDISKNARSQHSSIRRVFFCDGKEQHPTRILLRRIRASWAKQEVRLWCYLS